MRSRISRSLWQRFFSLLSQRPQSERFCLFHYAFANIFHIFKNSLIYCRFRLKLRAARLLQMRFATKSRFQQLPNLKIRSLLKIRNTIDINMSPRILTSDKKFCARSILRAAYQQKLSQDPFVPFPLYNILCADNLQ